MTKRLKLLSAKKKRRFFDRLDGFLTSGQLSPSRRRRRDGQRVGTSRKSSPRASPSVMTQHERLGRGGEKGADRAIIVVNGTVDAPPSDKMGRALPPAPLSGSKRRSSATPLEKTKRGKRASSVDPRDHLLRAKRVLLAPIGSDVSRKRIEIWEEMVTALGGSVVTHSATSPLKQRSHTYLLRLNKSHQTDDDGDTGSSEHKESETFDWNRVDIVVVSAQVDATKLQHHFHFHGALPSHLKLVTPDWLVFTRQNKRFPPNGPQYDWRGDTETTKAEDGVNSRCEAREVNQGDLDESGAEDDGSDLRNCATNEIIRAPPVHVDDDKIRREEAELKVKKDKLVNERIAIFHKLNPRFETIANASEGKKVKMEAFVCQKSSLMQANLNAHLTEPLEELMEFLHVERDIWREYSYKKVVSNLKAMRTRVSSVRDLKDLWWAKGRMREKVVEVLETGKLEKLEAKKVNPRLRTLVEMSRIWGVGPATAAKLYNMGYKSMDALRQDASEVLNFQQQIGLKHYDDFMTKIPRSEVQEIEKTVVDQVHRLLPNATALACGSYRRGKPSSGDCDVLITDPDSEECDILPELLRRLHESGFLTDDLTHISGHHMGGCDSYMGVCRLREGLPYRRLDIKVYPRRFFGFALLYFTGSDHFNRSMRLFARKKGWSLSDRSLKRVVRVRKGVKVESGESVICPHEVDVFIALGLEYKDPTERNCFDIRFLEEDEAQAKKRRNTGDTDPSNAEDGLTTDVTGIAVAEEK